MLTVYRPFSMFKDINSALDEIWNQDIQQQIDYSSKLLQDEKAYYLKAILPGFKANEINIEVKDGILAIVAEHKEEEKSLKSFRTSTSVFKKSFKLPKNVTTDNVSADYKSGVLLISLPKTEVKDSAKKISVTCSE